MEQHKPDQLEFKARNLDDAQTQKRLDLYSKGEERQFFSIQKIKQRYLNKTRQEAGVRVKSDLFYAQGVRAGMPHASHDLIKYDRQEADQDFRDSILKEAKQVYRRHDNFRRRFNLGSQVPLGRIFQKYRGHSLTQKFNKAPKNRER